MNVAIFFSIPLFLTANLFFFIIPGNLITKRINLKGGFWEKLIFSLSIGFVSLSLLSYILLHFKIDLFVIPIAILLNILWFRENYSHIQKLQFPNPLFKLNKRIILILLVFLIGILGQLAVISPSGINLNGDLVFWSSHAHDASWHIALIEEIKRGLPAQNPVYAGEKLVNYHFFSDLSLAIFNKYLGLNLISLYFRYFPLIYSILLGGTIFFLTKALTQSFSSSLWAVFFTYFTGSFGFILTLVRNKNIFGETVFGSSQVQSTIGNPPQITASFILISFLYFFSMYLKKQNKYLFLLLVLFASVLIVFKVYAGVVLIISLFTVGIWQAVIERKFKIFSIAVVSAFAAAILYLPNTARSASFLIFEPWWYIRTLVVYTNRLNWLDLELRRQTYLAEGNLKRVLSIEAMSFFIFFFGNLGMRFLGLLAFAKISLTFFKNYFYQLFILIISIAFIMPMLFLQKGVAGNTIQFLHYFLLLFGILAAITTRNLLDRIKYPIFKYIIILLIIMLSVPTQIGLLIEFYSRAPVAKIEKSEIEALNFLKVNSEKDSIILTAPFNKYLNINQATLPVWAWFDTAYVSAFSSRRTYLSDSEQVDIMGYDLNKRLDIEKNIFTTNNPNDFQNTLKDLNINYLYFPKMLRPKIDLNNTTFKKFFDNESVEIWKIN